MTSEVGRITGGDGLVVCARERNARETSFFST